MKVSFSIGILSQTGEGKKTNQDRMLVKTGWTKSSKYGLFVIADGMGGLASGGIASNMAVMIFRSWWFKSLPNYLKSLEKHGIDVLQDELDAIVVKVNKRIREYSKAVGDKMGTTLSVLFIYKDRYIIKHVGDSRIYKINDSCQQLTEDHSWIAQKLKAGEITSQQAKLHPERNILTQCIGVMENIQIFNVSGDVHEQDTFLLCSDGFYDILNEYEMCNTLEKFKTCSYASQNTADALMEMVKARGAKDDASVIVICNEYSMKEEGAVSILPAFFRKLLVK